MTYLFVIVVLIGFVVLMFTLDTLMEDAKRDMQNDHKTLEPKKNPVKPQDLSSVAKDIQL